MKNADTLTDDHICYLVHVLFLHPTQDKSLGWGRRILPNAHRPRQLFTRGVHSWWVSRLCGTHSHSHFASPHSPSRHLQVLGRRRRHCVEEDAFAPPPPSTLRLCQPGLVQARSSAGSPLPPPPTDRAYLIRKSVSARPLSRPSVAAGPQDSSIKRSPTG